MKGSGDGRRPPEERSRPTASVSAASPALLRLLARLLIPGGGREFILGDLEEMYAARAVHRGRGVASRRYARDVLISFLACTFSVRSGVRRGGTEHPVAPGVKGRSTVYGHSEGGRGTHGGGPVRGRRPSPLEDLLADLRFSLRSLRRERGFTALTVATLALGVGSTAAVFGMVNQLLLRPLPGVRDGDHAAYLLMRTADQPEGTWSSSNGLSTPDFDALRRDATLLAGMASYGYVDASVDVGDERPLGANGSAIYGDFFELLEAWPAAGRLLRASETRPEGDPYRVVLARRLSDRLFGSAEAAVGKTVRLNGHSFTVVGVAGGGFAGVRRGDPVEFWVPFPALVPLVGFKPGNLVSRNDVDHGNLLVRPRRRVSVEQAEAQLTQILRGLAQTNGDNESGPHLAKLQPRLYPGLGIAPILRPLTHRTLGILEGIVALVLLIACANVANLLLFRNVERRGVVATRRALGASSWRIARQHLVQSLALGVAGAVTGLGVGYLAALPFRGAELTGMPGFDGLILDRRVLLFAAAVSVATALLFGGLPAALAGRFDLSAALRQAGGRDTGRMARLRSALSAGQLALSLTLVVGAALLVRTVHNLYAVNMGIDVAGVVSIPLRTSGHPAPGDVEALYRKVLASVESLPGVEGAALDVYGLPSGTMLGHARLPDAPAEDEVQAGVIPVTPGWFQLFRVHVDSGRTFRSGDWGPGAPAGVVLTAVLARRLFGRTDVVGRTVMAGFGARSRMTVLGVVHGMRDPYEPEHPLEAFFVTYSQTPALPMFSLLVRTRRFDDRVARHIQDAVGTVLPDEPVPTPTRLSQEIDRAHADTLTFSHLLSLLSILAVLLSAVGLYGVVAFTVAGRRREFGVRIALGAESGRIARLVFRHAAWIIVVGTVLGIGGAYGLSRILRSRLFEVAPLDPASYGAAVALFAVVAGLACWVPARRAMRVDPVATLREE